MKFKYLIQYQEEGKNRVKVNDFTDEELEDFCKNKEEIKVTFLVDMSEYYEDYN